MTAPLPTPTPTLLTSEHTDWKFDSIVLRTTHRQCVCGARHTCPELFELWTKPGRILNKPTVATKMVPIHKASIPIDVEITQATRILPLAICPDCIASRPKQTKLPPLDEAEWSRVVKARATTSTPKKTDAKPRTLGDVHNLLFNKDN